MLRKKIFVTLISLIIIRMGHFIPIPNIDQPYVISILKNNNSFFRMIFNGENTVLSILTLGITHYINASIFIQFLTNVITFLEKLQFRGIPNITDSGVITNKEISFNDDNKYNEESTSYYNIITYGENFEEILQLKGIDPQKTYCNDIRIIESVLGIEAARTLLLKEYREIGQGGEFKSINYAHLSLLVDFMCQPGYIVSIDRYGINKLPTDPLTRASFEETTDQIMTAALFGEVNSMNGISSNIMAGQIIKAGTGMSQIIIDFDMIEKHQNKSEFKIKTNSLLNIKQDPMINNILNTKVPQFIDIFYPIKL